MQAYIVGAVLDVMKDSGERNAREALRRGTVKVGDAEMWGLGHRTASAHTNDLVNGLQINSNKRP